MNIAIIPARGGSKRIPRKNIKEFLGKPIISYPIQTAIESKLFDEIIVFTDDQEITDIANQYGATTPVSRMKEKANDTETLTETLYDFLLKYGDCLQRSDNICCILPTAVFMNTIDLIDSKNILDFNKLDSIISVNQYNHPIERAFKFNYNTGYLNMERPGYEFSRTQDLYPSYHDAGQFYWLYLDSFIEQHRIFMTKMSGYKLDAVDIDTEEDWKLAELKYKIKKGLI
jgi:pseudaminic acid cytidylyltransferase